MSIRFSMQMRIWLLLLALTGGSVLLAEEVNSRLIAIIAVFMIAAIKAELIIDHFMEARHAERHWLIMYFIWTITVTLLLIWGHLWN